MYITLTNISEQHRGNKVAIKKELISVLHSKFVTNNNGVIENITYIFCPPHGTWEVSETLEEIVEMLNAVDNPKTDSN
jgi:hypothetical protein